MAHSTGENKTHLATFVDNGIHCRLFTLSFFVDNVDEIVAALQSNSANNSLTCVTRGHHVHRGDSRSSPWRKGSWPDAFLVWPLKFRTHAVLQKRLVCVCVCTCSSFCRARPPLSTCAVVLSYDIMHRRHTWWHTRGRVTLCSRSHCEHTAVLILCDQLKNGVSISRKTAKEKRLWHFYYLINHHAMRRRNTLVKHPDWFTKRALSPKEGTSSRGHMTWTVTASKWIEPVELQLWLEKV